MYPYIDLSRMVDYPPCAVHVATQEQANAVIHNAREQFPERVSDSWDERGNYWRVYGEATGYTMYFEGEYEPTTISFSNTPFFEQNGYVVLEYKELLADAVNLIESDQPISLLVGGA